MSIQHPETSPRHWLIFSVILLAIAFIYIYRIGDKALDLDERYSMNIATGMGGPTTEYTQFGRFIANPIPGATFTSAQYQDRYKLSNVVSTAMNDNGQGLPYFFLLHGWLKFFGISTMDARLLSALLVLVSLLLMYTLMLRCGIETAIAMTIVVLFGCNGVVIGLAQYIRFYSLGILLTVLSCHLIWNMRQKEESKLSAGTLGLLWGVMLLNQFFAVFIVAAQAIYLLTLRRGRNMFSVTLPAAVGLLLPIVIWLLPLRGWESLRNIYTLQSSEHQAIYSLSTIATPLNVLMASMASFSGAVGQPANILSTTSSVLLQILPALPALLLICLIVFHRRAIRPNWIRLCLFALAIYLSISVLHSFATGFTLLFQGRYWVFAYVFSYLLLGWALMHGMNNTRGIKWLAIFALLVTCGRTVYTSASVVSGLTLTGHGTLVPGYIQPNEDYEGVAGTLIKTSRPGDTVSYKSWKVAQYVNWFLLQHPELTQRIDTAQTSVVVIAHGQLQSEVPINLGTTAYARPVWMK